MLTYLQLMMRRVYDYLLPILDTTVDAAIIDCLYPDLNLESSSATDIIDKVRTGVVTVVKDDNVRIYHTFENFTFVCVSLPIYVSSFELGL